MDKHYILWHWDKNDQKNFENDYNCIIAVLLNKNSSKLFYYGVLVYKSDDLLDIMRYRDKWKQNCCNKYDIVEIWDNDEQKWLQNI